MAAKRAAANKAARTPQKAAKAEADLPLVAQLKEAIRASGRTHYAIAKAAGINPSMVDRFMSGENDMRLATAAKVAAVLRWRLTPE
jgi:DNA-binding phage protein